ncbi:MAG: BatD family protein [Thermodesulfobacteriota bacterium]|nr:BatD family protein [Thermodesulfobacteriota bacterium]
MMEKKKSNLRDNRRLTLSGLIALLVVMAVVTPGFAQTPAVTAEVNRTAMAPGETLTLTVVIKGTKGRVNVSGIRDFDVFSSRSSQNYTIINGKTSREVRYVYTLVPQKTGRLLIPPLPVDVDGKTLYTEMIAIQVRQDASDGTDSAEKDVFATIHVSDRSPYIGQQIVCRVALYNAVRIGNAELRDGPVFDGFDARKLDDSRSYAKIISDRRYDVTELVYILTPEKTGVFQVGEARIMCEVVTQVPRRSGFPFNSFFNDSRMVPRIIAAAPVKVTVQPLPEYTGTGDPSGLVGEFDISAAVDATVVDEGDSCNLTITVKGRGNIRDAAMPALNLPEAFKVYQDTPTENVKVTEDGITGSKQFAAALVALTPGEYTIGPFSLTCFDTEKARYVTRSTGSIKITVKPAPGRSHVNVHEGEPGRAKPAVRKKTVDYTGKDIFSIKSGLDALADRDPISPWAFAIMLAVPYGVLGLLIAGFRYRQKGEPISRQMARQSRQALQDAKKDSLHMADHLYRAMIAAIYAKAAKQGVSLTRNEAAALLSESGCEVDFIESVCRRLDEIESVKYGGAVLDTEAAEDLLASARRIIRRLLP